MAGPCRMAGPRRLTGSEAGGRRGPAGSAGGLDAVRPPGAVSRAASRGCGMESGVSVLGLHDLGRDLADRRLVLPSVVAAEHQVPAARQDHADLGLSAAAVAAVSR